MTSNLDANSDTCVAAFPPYGQFSDGQELSPYTYGPGGEVTAIKPYHALTEMCYNPLQVDPDETPISCSEPSVDMLRLPRQPRKVTWLQDYEPIPAARLTGKPFYGLPIWRIELWGLGEDEKPLGFDIVGDVVIGRGPEADIRLDRYDAQDRGVSRQHAQLRPTREQLLLADLGSANGILVNGLPLDPAGAHAIGQGDVLTLGQLSFIVNIVEAPPDLTFRPAGMEAAQLVSETV